MSGLHGNAKQLDIGPMWLFDMQPTSVRHRAVLHIRYWADIAMSAQCRLLMSDQCEKPMSGRHGNARRLDIGPMWLFDIQPTSVRYRAVLHIRYRTDMKADVGPM